MPLLMPLEVSPHGDREIQIKWNDDQVQILSYELLRKSCPCAGCLALREDAEKSAIIDEKHQLRIITEKSPSADPMLSRADWVGNYAIRFVWEDGHDSGIYNYEYLREIGQAD